jgi:4-carboxymuconolactone decarboxylase
MGVDTREILRRLAIRDDAFVESVLACAEGGVAAETLGARTCALVRIGSLVALDAAAPAYMGAVEAARQAGASDEEIVSCLASVMPEVGVPRVVSAAPKLALALGYDVAEALEALDPTLS